MSPELLKIVTREAVAAARAVIERAGTPQAVVSVWASNDGQDVECYGFSHHVCPHDVVKVHRELADRLDRGEGEIGEVKT